MAICPSATYSAEDALHIYDNLWIAPVSVVTGIEAIGHNMQAVKGCFDLQGRRLSATAKGLYLKVEQTADGGRRVKKVAGR